MASLFHRFNADIVSHSVLPPAILTFGLITFELNPTATLTDPALNDSWVAGNHCMIGHIILDHGSGPNERVLADGGSAHNG